MRAAALLVISLLYADSALALAGEHFKTENVTARLVSESISATPGATLNVALELEIREGWHTYWKNPGDSGRATQIAWDLPAGFSAAPIQWTAPHRFDIPPLVNYGYERHAMHLVEIRVPQDLHAREVTLSAKADWLVCADLCIPESAQLRLTLPVGPAQTDAALEPLFAAARRDLPQPVPAPVTAMIRGDKLVLSLGSQWQRAAERIQSMAFFPLAEGSIEYGAPQTLKHTADALELAMKIGFQPPTGSVEGVLQMTERGMPGVAMSISAPLTGAAPPPHSKFAAVPTPSNAPASASLLNLLLLAMAGGLILNLMPCVFPVLSIKAIGLIEQAKKDPAAVRVKGLIFAAGVIVSMLTLAGILLALRAGGQQLGWGFQLQSPLFVTLMAYLLFAVGLNLSGVFEVGGSLAGVGDELAQGDGMRASFFTGVLTTLVATPCTAPFMAAAVGAALTQAPANALLIFVALGAGLSLPFVALSFAPALRRLLPRPGAWMDTLKQIFAFPMYASCAWLVWVLAQQTSPAGLAAAFAGIVLIAFVAWVLQRARTAKGAWRATAFALGLGGIALAIALPARFHQAAQPANAQTDGDWEKYDAAKLAQIVASGKPVLVNFTASWCLTCLVNERNAFADASVREQFARKGVTLVKGDWTNRDPAITQALAAFGRAGVPLYLVYNADGARPQPLILPQLLSATLVRDTFARRADVSSGSLVASD